MGLVETVVEQGCSWPLVVLTILFGVWYNTRRPPGIPPGPRLLPVVGNLLSLRGDVRKAFERMRKEYGDVFSLYLGSKLVIVFNGYDTLRDVFIKNADMFSDRPTDLFYNRFNQDGRGIITANGRMWRDQRRFALSTLRDLGLGKNRMEGKILEEMSACLKMIEATEGKPYDFQWLLSAAFSNIICSVAFGKRYEYDNPEFVGHLQRINKDLEIVGGTAFAHFFPFLQYLPGDPCQTKHLYESGVVEKAFALKHIAQHRKDFDGVNVKDFIDAYILESDKQKSVDTETTFSDDTLDYVIREFFVAGTETTSTTLRWALLYLALNPEEQSKIQSEIDHIIGHTRFPSMADKKSMPYTQAAILEIQRIGDVLPFSVLHATSGDTMFQGYRIPKNALIFPNISSVMMDPFTWPEPDKFRPSRFLDSEGKICTDTTVIPFSVGKRACLGESMARMELFLALTAILQTFTFQLPKDEATPSLQGILGATRVPKPYKICAVKRKI